MKIQIKDDTQLDELVICHKCHTLHQEVPIVNGTNALCTQCRSVLYRRNSRLLEHGLALSIAGLIFFILANSFPLLKVDIFGREQAITIFSMVVRLVESGYYIVALFVACLVLLFPLVVFLVYILLFSMMKLKVGKALSRRLLLLLSYLVSWNMSDIFLVSILVSMVKLMGMLEVHIGISFWTLAVFVILDIYMTRNIHMGELWTLRKNIYYDKNREEKDAN